MVPFATSGVGGGQSGITLGYCWSASVFRCQLSSHQHSIVIHL